MNTINYDKLNQFAENEIAQSLTMILQPNDASTSVELAKNIVKTIDWNDNALMHKGFLWITQNYLKQHNLI